MQNANRERDHYLRMAEVYDRETFIARQYRDEDSARIWESGANRSRYMAERWKRVLLGAK